MVNIIGRRQAFGLWKEVTSGTAVAVDVWIPKESGILNPTFEAAEDNSGFGRIEERYGTETVKQMSQITAWGIARDDFIGHLLRAALGQYTSVLAFTWTTGWTPARAEIVYQGASFGTATWIGVLKKITTVNAWATTLYWVSTTSWTFANGTDVLRNDDNWTLTSVDSTTYAGAYWHFFEVLNNNNHPSYTLYGSDPIDAVNDTRASYWMINTFNLNVAIADYVKFESEWMAKKLEDVAEQSPAYTTNNPFLAKNTFVYFADDEASLNWATAECLQSFNLNIEKNLIDTMCFGSDDVEQLNNQQFVVNGDFEALLENTTLRDLVADSTKQALRAEMINTNATALATNVFPTLLIDLNRVAFEEWSQSDDLNSLVSQTLGYTAEYKQDDASMIEILLVNDISAGY